MARDFDVLVVGGGHAGVEASSASARMGCRTALVTMSIETIGRMSCNPAIGGVGKGQIVREVDALGGVMGLSADATAVQFRMLNRSKGRAVWGPRCQSDRHEYERFVQRRLAATPNLSLISGEAVAVLASSGQAVGIRLAGGEELSARAVVVTAGTFLRGLMHRGTHMWPGGRLDEPAANALSESLAGLGLTLARLKTGTCARLAAETIDTSRCERQVGDERPVPFSLMSGPIAIDQLPCWITRTNARVHELIRANLARAPLYSGQITAVGPRYCPSIETKIDRFAEKDSHQLFLEPEGRGTSSVYVNGLSTSLPEDVQAEMIRLIPGLQRAEILRFGYAIEYDYAPPTQLFSTLECKCTPGLFLAGQVNGTTGYEEAAGLGLLAGINAGQRVRGGPTVVLGRDQAYIGVMIDDLVTKGVSEPYRMFTSRAEHRLQLRADNADLRLTELGRSLGLVDDERWQRFTELKQAVDETHAMLACTRLEGKSLSEWLANPQVTLAGLLEKLGTDSEAPPGRAGVMDAPNDTPHLRLDWARRNPVGASSVRGLSPDAVDLAVTDCRYAGYVARQKRQAEQLGDLDKRRIPPTLDYAGVPHLRAEARQKLSAIRPLTLGQALRVDGITPADVTVLAIHLHAGAGR